MTVAILRCPRCGDEWHVPNADPDDLRDTCRECGGGLTAEVVGA